MFIIAHGSKNPFTNNYEYEYLGYQPYEWDDGYFWTSKDTINNIIKAGYNTKGQFLFNTKLEAIKLLRKLHIKTRCKIIEWK